MKEIYTTPVCELITFDVEDIVTGSPVDSEGDLDLQGKPWGWGPEVEW